jgi:hypothetical protein
MNINRDKIRHILYHDLQSENDRRIKYEGFPEWDEYNPKITSEEIPENLLNYELLNFLISWKKYLKEASKNFRNTGAKCGICTAYSTWLGQKSGGIIQSVKETNNEIKSMTDLLLLKGCRTGKFSAFIVSLKFNWSLSEKEIKLLKKELGSFHFDMYYGLISKKSNDLELQTLLRFLLLSRSHIP